MNVAAKKFDGINKYIRITDIDENSSRYRSENPVSPAGNIDDKYLVGENDILFARTGASTGKSYLYNHDDGKLYFAGFLIRVKIKSEYNSKFIFSLTQTQIYKKWVRLISMRSGQPGINSLEFANFKFFLPSKKEEQDQIASFLSIIDERIQTQNKIIEQLETLIKGISEKLFSQKIRFKKFENKWNLNSLGNVLLKNSSKNKNQRYSVVQSVSNKHGFINQEEIFEERRVASVDTSNYYVIKKGCFAYNPSRINVGSLAYKNDEEISVISPLYISFRANNIFLSDIFLWFWFQTQIFKIQMSNSFEGSVRNTLSYENLITISILIPDIKEQITISKFLSTIATRIQIEKKLSDQYNFQKQYLLQNLFI